MSDLKGKYKDCLKRMKEVSALSSIGGLLSWDQETMMPERGTNARAEQSAIIAGVIHEKFVDPKMGELLYELAAQEGRLSAVEAVIVRERLRDYEKSVKLPHDLVRDLARVASLAQAAWIKARQQSDFSAFAPWLQKTIDLKLRQAEAYGYKNHPYDALLDDYEPYMTVAELDPVMDDLLEGLVPIVRNIAEVHPTREKFPTKWIFPEDEQEAMCRRIMTMMGIDLKAARMDRSAHPFCAGISSPTDVRMTTRFDTRDFTKALYNVLHEGGHTLYEQGLEERHVGTPLAESVSLGIHESQSRMWENIIGRSRAFLSHMMPLFKKHFPAQLKNVKTEDIYRHVNHVTPSFIRVDADEVTYNLHVALRYEIEKDLLMKKIGVRDLPQIWNDMMAKLLGLRPKKDAQGVLQDTHWASGLIGYFPTYLLGNLYSAQFWQKIRRDMKDTDRLLAKGDLAPILKWLREKIHRHGRRYSAAELVKRATGRPLCASAFLEYLKDKFGEIYEISF